MCFGRKTKVTKLSLSICLDAFKQRLPLRDMSKNIFTINSEPFHHLFSI
jgi:hypothetical protein